MAERRDALRNRAQLVAAAADVFREQGVGAPLDAVARRAQVGRATLYRHFPDRGALLAAVLEDRVATLEDFAAEHEGEDLLERLMVEMCWYQADVPGLVAAVNESAVENERLAAVTSRTLALLRDAHGVALRRGALRPDVTVDDVLLTTAMLAGVVSAREMPGGGVERALVLLLRGLRTEEHAAAPVPAAQLRVRSTSNPKVLPEPAPDAVE
ncbi:TetR/AcrR family transcriptional regulator [Actinotalea sp. C106]|uniref:TetR/AcrR family transcriptional regulator n=1 Tax=Actinotalea sp. C106 TaxID=2908644 RepID=UPI002028D19A|nr:TetR/AcrR family transcriptional regulator [Actinotalea sp. C106]